MDKLTVDHLNTDILYSPLSSGLRVDKLTVEVLYAISQPTKFTVLSNYVEVLYSPPRIGLRVDNSNAEILYSTLPPYPAYIMLIF